MYESKDSGCLTMLVSKDLEVVFLGMEGGTIRVMLWPVIEVLN